MNTQRMMLGWLVLILLLAAATHFHHIEDRSLWEDEGWTLLLSEGDSLSEVVQTMAYDQHPPLYFALIHAWRQAAGNTEFALRALSALISVLSVAAIYQLGRALFDRRVGMIAATLLAVWDFSIDIGQEVRHYSLLVLFVILSTTFYFRYLKNPNRSNGIGWFLCSVAVLYTQYVGGVILAFQIIYLLRYAKGKQLDMLLRFGAVCLAFVPWFIVFIRQNQVRWDDPIYYQSGLPNNQQTYMLVRDALLTHQFGLILGLLLLGLIFIRYQPTAQLSFQPLKPILFLGMWVCVYIALFVWLNEQREILRLRIFTVVMPAILILVAHGLSNLQRVPQTFLLGIILLSNLTSLDTRLNNPPWRDITQTVTDFHQVGEPVLMDIWVGDFPARYYVEHQMGKDTAWLSLRELRSSAGDFFLPQLVGYLEDEDAFWLIRWGDELQAYDGVLAEQGFQRTHSVITLHEGNQIFTHRYDRLTDERLATFGDSLDLIKASVTGDAQPNAEITITLWWTIKEPPPVDYSISIRLLDETGTLIANQDGPPLDGKSPTSTWQVGQIQYDQHQLRLPPNLPSGQYAVAVSIYWYLEPNNPLVVESAQDTIAGDHFAKIADLTVGQ